MVEEPISVSRSTAGCPGDDAVVVVVVVVIEMRLGEGQERGGGGGVGEPLF